jgi:CubicO group peptidase (beta-lactamase class C family)
MLQWGILVVALLAVGLGIWGYRTVDDMAEVGTANKAMLLCSAVFVSGRDPDEVLAAELAGPELDRIDAEIDRQARSVTASMLWANAEAVHRPGIGCTRLVGVSAEALHDQVDLEALPPAPDLATENWPRGDRIGETEALPFDRAALDAVLDGAIAEPDPEAPRATRAVVVVWRGELIGERYAPGFDASMPLTGWSMTKSLTNALIGLRVMDGTLELEASAPVPEWQDPEDPRSAITLDQLLRMSSALEFGEVYGSVRSDAVQMLFGPKGRDMGGFAASKPLVGPPDSVWNYSSGTTNLVQRILRDSFDDLEAYHGFVRGRLLHPLGMTRTTIAPDASGTMVGSSFGYATARDWARLGLLFLQDGVWEGERLLPEGWVDYSTRPTPEAPQGSYGAHWWLNAGTPDDAADRPWPELPPGAYSASGFEGQYTMVVPSHDLVVVRQGYTPEQGRWSMAEFTARVMETLDP